MRSLIAYLGWYCTLPFILIFKTHPRGAGIAAGIGCIVIAILLGGIPLHLWALWPWFAAIPAGYVLIAGTVLAISAMTGKIIPIPIM